MERSGEHIYGFGGFQIVAAGGQEADVAGEGGGIAAHVDEAGRGHFGNGVDHVRGQALAGRVDDDTVRAGTLRRKATGRLGGVRAEEFRIFNSVSPGVFLRVFNGLGDDLHANGLTRGTGEGQRDRTRTAVEIQDGLVPFQIRQGDGKLVQALGLGRVDLIERPRREPETEAAELVLDRIGSEKRMEFIAQDRVAGLLIDGKDDGLQAGDRLSEAGEQAGRRAGGRSAGGGRPPPRCRP